MRTITPVALALALGVATLMLSLSGFAAAWGSPAAPTPAAQENLNSTAGENSPSGSPISGPVSAQDSSTVGLIADALGTVTGIAGAVVFIPQTLTSLGFPSWFAVPLGRLAQILATVGIIQFAVNRVWQ